MAPNAGPRISGVFDETRAGLLAAALVLLLIGTAAYFNSQGGVFLYPPAVDPATGAEKSKLRLLYEASPLAFVVEQAGGYASDGVGGILRRQPQELHERVPLYIGSAEDVREFEARLRAS